MSISELCHQSGHGTSTCWTVGAVSVVEAGGEEIESVVWKSDEGTVVWVGIWGTTTRKLFLGVAILRHVSRLSHLAGIG